MTDILETIIVPKQFRNYETLMLKNRQLLLTVMEFLT